MPEELARRVTARPAPGAPAETRPGRILPSITAGTDEDQIQEIVGRLERRYSRDQISTGDLTGRVRRFYDGLRRGPYPWFRRHLRRASRAAIDRDAATGRLAGPAFFLDDGYRAAAGSEPFTVAPR